MSMLNVSILSNNNEYPYQARFLSTLSLNELKIKLELIVGIYTKDMKLELRTKEGKYISELIGDTQTLEDLGVHNDSYIYVAGISALDNSADISTRYVGKKYIVQVANNPRKIGTVAFIGTTHFKPGNWIGIIYDEPTGKNDGSVEGQRYFTCEKNYGAFVKPSAIIDEVDDDDFSLNMENTIKTPV